MSTPPAIPEELTDGVVRVRPIDHDDIPAYAQAFRDDPTLGSMIGADPDPDEELIRKRLADRDGYHRAGGFPEMAVEEVGGLRFAGTVGLFRFTPEHRRSEVGFWLAPQARGRGLGSRAVRLMTSYAFETLGLERVEMTTEDVNAATRALARRLGFREEGLLVERDLERGRRINIVILGMLRREWSG